MRENRKEGALHVVEEVGRFLMQSFRKVRSGKDKGDGSLVSDADLRAEKIILSTLRERFPNDRILSEEVGDDGKKSDYCWIVDPLDGTHNFLSGFPFFGSLLALEYLGEIVLSVCAFPAFGELFVAEKGKGAFLNDAPIHVSLATQCKGSFFFSGGNFREAGKTIFSDIQKFTAAGCRLRMIGSSAFSMTRVALGQAVIATDRAGTPWDIAAPALLVEEAGGRVTDPSGARWRIDSKEIIATNGILHDRSLSIFHTS